MALLGAAAALGSSVTWAYASTRYAQASRDVGSQRVNLARATVVLPIYLAILVLLKGMQSVEKGKDQGTVWPKSSN